MGRTYGSIGFCCKVCFKEVPAKHFTAMDGRILCEEHSIGVEPCSKESQKIIDEINGVTDRFYDVEEVEI